MIRVRQVKVRIEKNSEEELKKQLALMLKVNVTDILNIKIGKKSLDARKKNEVYYVYEVDVEVDNEKIILNKNKSNDIFSAPKEEYKFNMTGKEKLENRPIVVGSGPAGLFSAYMLSINGYKPLVIERGECVEERIKTVEEFWESGILNHNSNVQFG